MRNQLNPANGSRVWIALGAWLLLAAASSGPSRAVASELTDVTSWASAPDRHWVGAGFWANRLQDWAVRNGELTCTASWGGWNTRTAHLLTHDLSDRGGAFRVELDLRRAATGQAGLLIAGGEGRIGYKKASLIQGQPGTNGGFLVVWDFDGPADGGLKILDFGTQAGKVRLRPAAGHAVVEPLRERGPESATLSVEGRVSGDRVTLTAQLIHDVDGGRVVAQSVAEVDAARVVGNVAVVSSGATAASPHRFLGLRLGGDRVASHPERAFGPIAGVLYGVANGDLKVGVQCVSLGQTLRAPSNKPEDGPARLAVRLEQKQDDGTWAPVGHPTAVSEPDYYALIRVRGYDASRPRELRVVTNGVGDLAARYGFHVPAEPTGDLVVGAVSCSGAVGRRSGKPEWTADGELYAGRWSDANIWAPWEGVTRPLLERKPDIVFFTGDQLYEYNPTPRSPTDAFPEDDYLYKWLMWHWAFNDLTRRVPTVIQTDDHDVWHPNLWGEGGRLMVDGWDSGGGYMMSSYFVNMVQRTMCGHNPDPYDPGPLDSGVTNYFTTFTYGGVDFAVLEDRKFKSASKAEHRQGKRLRQLGDAQLRMLAEWADAPGRSPARIVVSQTNYAKVFTNVHSGAIGREFDTNGWPKAPRDVAVAAFEKAGALLFTGDQHLSTVVRLRTETGPGVVQFCQPAAGCIWWRSFVPADTERVGLAPGPDAPDYAGRYADGFGNAFDVMAVANPGSLESVRRHTNPQDHRLTPDEAAQGIGDTQRIHRGEGFAVLHVQPGGDRVTLECWPLDADVSRGPAAMFPGWPIGLELSGLRPAARPRGEGNR